MFTIQCGFTTTQCEKKKMIEHRHTLDLYTITFGLMIMHRVLQFIIIMAYHCLYPSLKLACVVVTSLSMRWFFCQSCTDWLTGFSLFLPPSGTTCNSIILSLLSLSLSLLKSHFYTLQHLYHMFFSPLSSLELALWQKRQMAHLCSVHPTMVFI